MPLTCRSCGTPIFFARTRDGNLMPLESLPPPPGQGNVILQRTLEGKDEAITVKPGEGKYRSHFATCPNAQSFRRKT
jgi:hypothetical protein